MSPTVWQVLNEMRESKAPWTIDLLAERLTEFDSKPTAHELWMLCQNFHEKADKPSSIFDALFSSNSFQFNFSFETFFGDGSGFSPWSGVVFDFVRDFLTSISPKSLFNPWSRDPVSIAYLTNVLSSLETVVAVTSSKKLYHQANLFRILTGKLLGWKKEVQWRLAQNAERRTLHRESPGQDTLETIADSISEWDTVICYAPVGQKHADHQISGSGIKGTLEIHDSDSSIIALLGALKLSESGVGLFSVPLSFFSLKRPNSTVNLFEPLGIMAEAFISFPGVNSGLLIARKGSQEPMFVAELHADPNRRALLIENLVRKREGKEPALGMLVDRKEFRGYAALKDAREYERRIARQGLPLVNLTELLQEVRSYKRNQESAFDEKTNAIYLPRIGMSPVVTSTEEFRLKPHNYFQLVLKPDLVNPDFFANFLNSEIGLLARRTFLSGGIIPGISLGAIRKGIQVPLPALSVQTAVMVVDTRLRDLATDVKNLRAQLWSRPAKVEEFRRAADQVNRRETFDDWLKTLPFPLASILWNYHTAVYQPKEQFELLLKFFEALAEFLATILLSAARRDLSLWAEVQPYLIKERNKIELSSFGTWVEMIAFVGKRLREMWNDVGDTGGNHENRGRARCEAALGTTRAQVTEALTSKHLLGVLKSANQFRNDYGGHYGVLGEEKAASFLVQLRSFLSDVRSSFGQMWESYQLVLPTNQSEWNGQHHEVVVNLLQGLNTPFLKETRRMTEPLRRNTLYFLDKENDHPIELLPLVKISNAPKDVPNACYFYNRKQAGGTRYISYHFEREADRTFPAAETERLFKELFGT